MGFVSRGVATLALLVLACTLDVARASAASRYRVHRVGVFKEPVYLATPKQGSRLFVVERAGRIRVVRGGKVVGRPFLDISRDVITAVQRGLFSIAFAPDYASSGRFYVMYTRTDDTVQVDEFHRSPDPDRADPASRRPLLNVGLAGPFHHGGQLQFGPDGLLYISTGVTDRYAFGQDLGDLHGKILRIDPPPGRRPAVQRAGRQPVRRGGGRPPGGLGLRAAQPVEVLLRPRHRRLHLGRRRRAHRRGGRLPAARRADRGEHGPEAQPVSHA